MNKHRRRVYMRWHHIFERCYNPKRKDYKYYGGKGIGVDSAWHNFGNFFAWYEVQTMLHRNVGDNAEVLVVDRIDETGYYSPWNCRLLTAAENSRRAIHARDSRGRFAIAK